LARWSTVLLSFACFLMKSACAACMLASYVCKLANWRLFATGLYSAP
jgi:hypothetical protein